ncbi:MAG: methyltransferase domain-containing protein [Thermofilaceae archaeon]
MRKAPVGIVYPIPDDPPTLVERIALSLKVTLGYCPVCGRFTFFWAWGTNLRETGVCAVCRSKNRQRQLAYVLCRTLSGQVGFTLHSLSDLHRLSSLSIYNTEASGSLHAALSRLSGYVASEYFGPGYLPGEMVNGVRHEDLTALSFPDASFDIVLSSDVLEHVSNPYQAHREIWRVLRPGGRHIFTVPFHQTRYLDEVLAEPGEGGTPRVVKKALYHDDPLRPEGALVYTIFSLEMLIQLAHIGFRTLMYRLYQPLWGILGSNGLVFEAIKEE